MRRHAMEEWTDTDDEEGAAKAFDAMDERIRPPIGAHPRRITPSRTTLDACQRAGCPIEAGAIHAWLCTWSVRRIDGTVIRRDMLLIDVKRENEIWKAISRYRLDGVFSSPSARELGEDVRRDMLLAEAQEYGLVADDATDARTIPDDVLGELGLTAQEVGQ